MDGFSALFVPSEPSVPGSQSVVPTCTGAFVSGKTQAQTPIP
ncbi:hypothetical protein XELAEV_180350242mg, partial [Xenopus laevis]